MLTVQERLPLLIQKRLEAEIQQRPLLFPWETELDEDEISEVEFETLRTEDTEMLEESRT